MSLFGIKTNDVMIASPGTVGLNPQVHVVLGRRELPGMGRLLSEQFRR